MELTGKAKKDFESWVCRPDDPGYVQQMHIDLMYGKYKEELYLYYKKFMQDEGIYIDTISVIMSTSVYFKYRIYVRHEKITNLDQEIIKGLFTSKFEATEYAIEEVNKIYNQKFRDEN